MLNKIILIGRLVRDPELRYTQSGIAVAKFTIAVDRPFTNRQGEKETDFIDIVVWRKLAEICSNNLGKGRLVAVEGQLQIRSYDDRQGIRRKTAEVVADNVRFLDWPKDQQEKTQVSNSSSSSNTNNTNNTNLDDDNFGSEITFSEDDIPF